MGIVGPGRGGITKGYADGFVAKYDDSTHVDITAGIYEVDGKIITLAADANYVLTSIPAGFDWIYIYLNKSASTSLSPSFYNGTDEPVFNPTKRGWYHPTNTSDRLVAAVFTPDSGVIIAPYSVIEAGNKLRRTHFSITATAEFAIATNMNPDGTWQTPNMRESSVILPINAVQALFRIGNQDSIGALVSVAVTNSEIAALESSPARGEQLFLSTTGNATLTNEISLGDSRNVKVFGNPDDDNFLSAWLGGCTYAI